MICPAVPGTDNYISDPEKAQRAFHEEWEWTRVRLSGRSRELRLSSTTSPDGPVEFFLRLVRRSARKNNKESEGRHAAIIGIMPLM
jgi:hypothetical protein